MSAFRHVQPAFRVHYGEDSLQRLGAELDRLGCTRAVVFCGRTLARNDAVMTLVTDALGARYAGIFSGVAAHSPLPSVMMGAEALRSDRADAVVALGGGSAVVTARAASILLAEGPDIDALCTRYAPGKPPESPRLAQPKLPQLVLATTPTTAYAKAGAAVLDPARGQRLALFDPRTRAAALFIHPLLARSAPFELVRGAAVQAFAMAVQGVESTRGNPLADAPLLHALRLLARELRALAREPDDAETRGQLMLGALLAGEGSDYAPPGLATALAHCIGARLSLDNGVSSAVLLPHAMRYNAEASGKRLEQVGEALGITGGAARAIDATERLLTDLALPRTLREIGVPQTALPQLAEDAMGDWFLHQNPRRIDDSADILALLRAAW